MNTLKLSIKKLFTKTNASISLNSTKSNETVPILVSAQLGQRIRDSREKDEFNSSILDEDLSKILLTLIERKPFSSLEELGKEICEICILDFKAENVEIKLELPGGLVNAKSTGISIFATCNQITNHVHIINKTYFIQGLKLTLPTFAGRKEKQTLKLNLEIQDSVYFYSYLLIDLVDSVSNHAFTNSKNKTLENLLESLAQHILECYPVETVTLNIEKTNESHFSESSTSIEMQTNRSWLLRQIKYCEQKTKILNDAIKRRIGMIKKEFYTVFIALISNKGNRLNHIEEGISILKTSSANILLDTSFLYESSQGGENSNLNVVIKIQTESIPEALFKICQTIEKKVSVEIIILFYDNQVLSSEEVTIPHPEIHKNLAVLQPLCDIAKSMIHPKLKVTCGYLLKLLQAQMFSPQGQPVKVEQCLEIYRFGHSFWDWRGKTLLMVDMPIKLGDSKLISQEAKTMFENGADILNVNFGTTLECESIEEVIEKTIELIKAIKANDEFSIPIAIDALSSSMARAVVNEGADIIIFDQNSEESDPEMFPTLAELGVPIIFNPTQSATDPKLSDSGALIVKAVNAGIYRWNIILDKGLEMYRSGLDGFPSYVQLSKILKDQENSSQSLGVISGVIAACVSCGMNIIQVEQNFNCYLKELSDVVKVSDHIWK